MVEFSFCPYSELCIISFFKSGKKKTNDKNIKNVQEREMDDEDNNMETDSYLKERDEAPGTSKHLQKKAKKMAKKQAKVGNEVGLQWGIKRAFCLVVPPP